ncbi:hypothetical protein N656DRAFT_719528 [Canariomyces notabilis]|uniref:DUF7719 domain-containing protein n=1 Tax=Canariomyces notabilis TaxID=2074819 RepID=A0AAN6QHW3_9PEZI|nr:hypothetical protein N656DRAFT_719528 [Canariomyces arenarius]
MARRRRDKSPSNLKLRQPDRSGPSEKTLLQLAEERGLFDQAKKREDEIAKKAAGRPISEPARGGDEDGDAEGLPPAVERVLETLLWSVSLAMLHFTLDVLVQHQFSVDRIVWPKVVTRTAQALLVFGLLIYALHPHPSSPSLLPGLPARYQPIVRQGIFFTASVCAGCYLIHITNMYGYLAVMKRAPSLGCLWVWSVIELELPWAVLSLAGAGLFLWMNGYSIK